ncbi:zinc-finger domain-containing protein [Ferdinandcohnia quinoae]|uniref:Zinc-finger domain-containing protein n=1 Tax=Fredinandcohnia quinoae TaxID=2918902 RepID=A0AAW5E4D8_9BACI|nr:zinc-finger domain-containing protein [Fredinandcohnia sp. SECRCQ15]MCH1627353.1 zinc-finger domain-containing protein [Fredinandcohnia sp. SECRCQ15]
MKRRKLILEVGEVLDTYCQDCFVKDYFRKEYGKRYAQSFCIEKCTVGEKLKEYGKQLS